MAFQASRIDNSFKQARLKCRISKQVASLLIRAFSFLSLRDARTTKSKDGFNQKCSSHV